MREVSFPFDSCQATIATEHVGRGPYIQYYGSIYTRPFTVCEWTIKVTCPVAVAKEFMPPMRLIQHLDERILVFEDVTLVNMTDYEFMGATVTINLHSKHRYEMSEAEQRRRKLELLIH